MGDLKNRSVLADVSNQLGKRRFVSISSISSDGLNESSQKSMGSYGGVENIGKGKCVFEFGGKGDSSVLKAKQIGGSWNLESGVKPLHQHSVFGISRTPGEEYAKKTSDGVSGSDIKRNPSDGEEMDVGDLTSNKSSSIEGSVPSSGSKECESEKCVVAFNHDGSSDTTTGIDLLKTCSCSFCLKAAYIWSDLQYQDTKGRIAALKRSRKDVRSVIERSCSYGGFGKAVQGNSKPTKLEHDLMGQWRSLFLHTEDVLIRESTELQSSLLTLKELRENCKADLEMTNATSLNS